MSVGAIRSLLGRWWLRITVGGSIVLVGTLGIVVFATYELTLDSERSDLDEVLACEGTVISDLIVQRVDNSEWSGSTQDRGDNVRLAVGRALAINPGSAVHLVVVRWGGESLSSARGPGRLLALRDSGVLPEATSGRLESRDGVRIRSQEIAFPGFSVFVDTFGDDEAIAADARNVAQRTLLAASFAGLIGLSALAVTVRRSSRLIAAVSRAVRETRLDNLSHRIEECEGSHEIAVLAQDVNTMLEDLRESRAARNELIASVSHEIRTPLAAARGHTELLRDGIASDPKATVARVDRELLRMTRLVDDLLALSRSADPRWISTQMVNVRSIVADVAERVSAQGGSKVVIGGAPDLLIDADPDRLLQALSNLVTNAIIHTPNETSVTVSVRVTAPYVEFVVTDDGPGIPPEVLERFGQAFVRGSETGTGLGLMVSRAIAEAHHGTLTVRSDESGTEVTIRIPVDRPT